MIKVSVMYPNSKDAKFNFDYYCNAHVPLLREKLGTALKGVAVEKGLPDALYLAMAHLYFESVEIFESSFAPHDDVFGKDVPNYTDIKPVFQISEVLL